MKNLIDDIQSDYKIKRWMDNLCSDDVFFLLRRKNRIFDRLLVNGKHLHYFAVFSNLAFRFTEISDEHAFLFGITI